MIQSSLVSNGRRRLPHVLVALTYWNFVSFQGGSIIEAHHILALFLRLGITEAIAALCAKWSLAQQGLVSVAIILWLDTQLNYFESSQSLLSSTTFEYVALIGLIVVFIGLSLIVLIAAQRKIGDPFYLFALIAFSVLTIFVVAENIFLKGSSHAQDSRFSEARSSNSKYVAADGNSATHELRRELNGKSYVHIVLDAHASLGVNSADSLLVSGIKQSARESLLGRDFVLGTHTFSRYFLTHDSVPNTLNFTKHREHKKLLNDAGQVTELKLFEHLSASGYEGHFFQSTWLDFCHARNINYRTCKTYMRESVVPLISEIPSMVDRLKVSYSLYAVGFPLVNRALVFYTRLLIPKFPALPAIHAPGQPLSLMAFDILSDLESSVIQNADKRSFYFAHVLMPHSPYSVDSSCTLRQPIGFWRGHLDPEAMRHGAKNSPESRNEALKDYYQQLSCLYSVLDEMLRSWQDAGVLDDLVIVMHGDHGSRLSLSRPRFDDQLSVASSQNDRDNFQTHFAYRIAGNTGRLDRRQIGLQDWFAEFFGEISQEPNEDVVFVRKEINSVKGRALSQRPYFASIECPELDETC